MLLQLLLCAAVEVKLVWVKYHVFQYEIITGHKYLMSYKWDM